MVVISTPYVVCFFVVVFVVVFFLFCFLQNRNVRIQLIGSQMMLYISETDVNNRICRICGILINGIVSKNIKSGMTVYNLARHHLFSIEREMNKMTFFIATFPKFVLPFCI